MAKSYPEQIAIRRQAKELPTVAGVYLFRGKSSEILYVGKAKNLRARVRSYFGKHNDWKTDSLVKQAVTVDHRVTGDELEAMMVEAQLIETHQPPFNVLLKNGRPFLYFVFKNGKLPRLELVRNRARVKGENSVGPFFSASSARALFNLIERTFQLRLCNRKTPSGCLYYHMNRCAGACRDDFDLAAYKHRLALAQKLCTDGPAKFLDGLKREIKRESDSLNFEQAQQLNRYAQLLLKNLGNRCASDRLTLVDYEYLNGTDIWISTQQSTQLFRSHSGIVKKLLTFPATTPHEQFLTYYRCCPATRSIFTNFSIPDRRIAEQFISKWHSSPTISIIDTITDTPPSDVSLAIGMANSSKTTTLSTSIQQLLKLPHPVHTIDCFDISHTNGRNIVGSCIRFTDGMPTPTLFRKFKLKTVRSNNDYAALQEIVSRRYLTTEAGKTVNGCNEVKRIFPDLILIDGGKGQLNAIRSITPEATVAALAKQKEQIFSQSLPTAGKELDEHRPADSTLIAIRDYAHHFAISYHRKKRVDILNENTNFFTNKIL